MLQVQRFHQLLLSQTQPAPDHVQRMVRDLSNKIRLRVMPEILQTSVAIAPLVWWVGSDPPFPGL
jgi:hypothetical protein